LDISFQKEFPEWFSTSILIIARVGKTWGSKEALAMSIWERCPKSAEAEAAEREAEAFLLQYKLNAHFSLEAIEELIYNCPQGGEDRLFDPVVAHLTGDLAVLYKFDQVFRTRLFAHVPQKSLNGLSPVRFALNLQALRDS
jgi:hypothetical protein